MNELLETAAALGSIVGVWFALMGWKLLQLKQGPAAEPRRRNALT